MDSIDQETSLVTPKSNWEPPKGRDHQLDTLVDYLENYPLPKKKSIKRYNISLDERKAIDSLSKNTNIIIKEADKGSAIVVMD